MSTIDNTEDVLDSRDIIERIEELETMLEGLGSMGDADMQGLADEWQEMQALKALAKECEGYGDWEYGETLIRSSYFVEYITDLIHDCYEMPKEMHSGQWPYCHITIDYEAAARDAEHDYMTVDFNGQEYLMRA